MVCKTRCFDSGNCTSYIEGTDYKFSPEQLARLKAIGLAKHFDPDPEPTKQPIAKEDLPTEDATIEDLLALSRKDMEGIALNAGIEPDQYPNKKALAEAIIAARSE